MVRLNPLLKKLSRSTLSIRKRRTQQFLILAALLLGVLFSSRFLDFANSKNNDLIDTSLYKVTRVIDGDTVEVSLIFKKPERVRIKGIDTPEIGGAACDYERQLAENAKSRAIDLLYREDVYLRNVEGRDVYSRLLADVVLKDGRDFGDLMIKEGHAVKWPNDYDWCAKR